MTQRSKIFIGLIGILFASASIWTGYYIITPYVIGPKFGVQLACSSIQSGTQIEQLDREFEELVPIPDMETALIEAILHDVETKGESFPASLDELRGKVARMYEELDYYSYLDLGYHESLEEYLKKELESNNGVFPLSTIDKISKRLKLIESAAEKYSPLDNGRVQIYTINKSGWLCSCHVEMENGRVADSHSVMCSN